MPQGLQLCYPDADARSVEGRIITVEPAPAVVLDATVSGRIDERIRIKLGDA